MPCLFRRSSLCATCASLLLALLACNLVASAAPPVISDLDLRGLQIGAANTLTISGSNLGTDSRLLIPGVTLQQSIMESPGSDAAQRVTFSVLVDPQANPRPGLYPLWLATPRGVSNPVIVSLDSLKQLAFQDQVDALPVALHGQLQGETILKVKVPGRAGMKLVADVQSRRLGAATKLVVRILNPRGTQIEWSEGIDRLSGDPRCEAQLPEDGIYTVQLHDILYRGEAPGYFVLKLGELAFADLAFPLGIQRGQTAEFQLLQSNQPGSVSATPSADWLFRSLPLVPALPNFVGTAPRIAISDHPEMVEPPSTGAPIEISAAPIAVSGRLQAAKEEDRFAVAVQPGTTLRIDMFAERFGSPLDGVLVVRGEGGNELARSDDQPGTPDPGLDFAVPEGVNKVVIAVTDLLRRGGNEFVYRLSIRDAARPQFTLALDVDRLTLPAGGTQLVRVTAQRSGYNGPIALQWEGLPADVQISGQPLAAGVDGGLVVLRAPANAVVPTLVRVIGQALEGDTSYQTLALTPDSFRAETSPWNRQYLAVAGGEPAALQLAMNPSALESLPRGAKVAVPFTVTRATSATGKVRVRLLSNQPPPKKVINENNQQREVDDTERAIRLEADVLVDSAASEGIAQVIVPADLEEKNWTVVFLAELLAPDDQTVIATGSTDARQLPVTTPLRVELASGANIEAKAGLGETGKFSGKVIRTIGLDQPVNVTLVGLPAEYPGPMVQVPAGQEDFELSVAFPYGAPAADLKNVQLVAEMTVPSGPVRSAGVPVEIKVVAGEKPQ